MKTITVFLLIISSFTYGQERKVMPIPEIREVIKLAIDLPKLQKHYHIDIDSSRIPLIINQFGLINSENMKGIVKFGQEIEIIDVSILKEKGIRHYLHVGDWTYGGIALRLQLSYPIEGIMINYRFEKKNGNWEIVNSVIVEE